MMLISMLSTPSSSLNERYEALKHMRSPHHSTEVTRVSRRSDGTVVRDHEVFQDGVEVEHDRTSYQTPLND